jgi:proteasome lid subunit RPN8/RPN11
MKLHVSLELWTTTWYGLQRRSAGENEAACVWLGTRSPHLERALEVVYLDDLPGTVGRRLQHRTSRQAVDMMLELARTKRMSIVGDLHTHPGEWVDLSEVDREHPIEYRVGLLALVIPSFGRGGADLTRTGVHEYAGAGRWNTFESHDHGTRIEIEVAP